MFITDKQTTQDKGMSLLFLIMSYTPLLILDCWQQELWCLTPIATLFLRHKVAIFLAILQSSLVQQFLKLGAFTQKDK